MTTYDLSLALNTVSMASLVVPSTSETITLFWFKKAFVKEDLPTFGLPIIANLIMPS